MITFTEDFMGITMSYGGRDGYKGYSGIVGATHQIQVYNTSNKRNINKQSSASYDQDIVPTSVTYGRDPDIVTIEGPLCHLSVGSGNFGMSSVNDLLSTTTAHRVNTLFNTFVPCCKLLAASDNDPSIDGNTFIVDTFKIKRNIQKRSIVMFELIIRRWYE